MRVSSVYKLIPLFTIKHLKVPERAKLFSSLTGDPKLLPTCLCSTVSPFSSTVPVTTTAKEGFELLHSSEPVLLNCVLPFPPSHSLPLPSSSDLGALGILHDTLTSTSIDRALHSHLPARCLLPARAHRATLIDMWLYTSPLPVTSTGSTLPRTPQR